MKHGAKGDRYQSVPPWLVRAEGRISGLPCPKCKSHRSAVADSRPAANHTIRRRRCCLDCDWRFSTYETSVDLARTNTNLLTEVRALKAGLLNLLERFAETETQLLLAGASPHSDEPETQATTPEEAA